MCSTPRLRTCCGGARGSPRSRTTRRCTSRISRRPSRRSWTSSPLRRTESRWRSEVRDGPPRREVGRMTHENVEILIGKLVTDEELREAFQQNPHAVLTWLRHQGLQLSSLEMEALTSISPSELDRKSTRLNSSHANISYAVFCLKKKKIIGNTEACSLATTDEEYLQPEYQHP